MPKPVELTPLEQSRQHKAARDAQYGIAAKPEVLWPFDDWRFTKADGIEVTAAVLIDYRFMDGTENQQKAVRSTIETRLKPRGATFDTWEDCANVKFRDVTNNSNSAQVRITFKVEGSPIEFSSLLGTEAVDVSSQKATMKLIGLPDKYPPTKEHRGNILHEFGHVLGLEHEHQSPTLEGYLGTQLDEKAIIDSHHGNEAKARYQIIDKVVDPTNYTRFDKDSIMVYNIKRKWQAGTRNKWFGKKIVSSDKLSELDKAFIRLMYPPDLAIEANRSPFLQAMHTAGVPPHVAGQILNDFVQNNGSLVERLTAVRDRFNRWKADSIMLFNPNQALLQRAINPIALSRSGVTGFIGEATKNKLFQAIVKNVVYRTMEQSGIPTRVSLPGSTQNEVMSMLGALAMHDDVGQSVKYYDSQFSKKSNVQIPSSDPDINDPSDPRDRTPDKEIPQETAQVDLNEWKRADGFATVHITKPKNEKEITVDIRAPLGKQAVLTLDKESVKIESENVDVKGVFYYNDEEEIDTATKAKWTLEWVVFYRDRWERRNFTACFIPLSTDSGSTTDLVSGREDFEHVQWKKM